MDEAEHSATMKAGTYDLESSDTQTYYDIPSVPFSNLCVCVRACVRACVRVRYSRAVAQLNAFQQLALAFSLFHALDGQHLHTTYNDNNNDDDDDDDDDFLRRRNQQQPHNNNNSSSNNTKRCARHTTFPAAAAPTNVLI